MKISARTIAAVSGLLDQVLELPAAEREPWLQKLALTQPEMVPVLREMLAAREQSGFSAVLQSLPKIAGDATAAVATSALHEGERVGPYLLKRELGIGGMAVVWLAQRADGAFKRDVALKVPMLSRLRRDLADRFERERDILAGLEHVNIARLYDAGVAEDGLPYLALEYVEGQPITSWCDTHHYGIRERLKLFLQVLDAVQYAHARHVIHRDIKPSNILVTESGQVRLLDFGIAKLLIEGEIAEETQLTQLYGRAFTVDYASPEQLRGEPVTAASDIYALGVVLYELLTGNRPYQIKATTAALIEQAIVNAEIAKPSTHVGVEAAAGRSTTLAKLTHRLQGDLDAIVLKSLAKAPSDRYASAEALADDLQRYLTGEAVEAQPDRLTYRTKKYVLRHRVGAAIATAAIGALALVIGLVLSRPPTTAPAAVVADTPHISDKSIAVLPFVDMSEGKDQEYFSDGLAEEVLNLLSRVPELHVIARTSAFSFKGKPDDIPTIARKLLVANVLEGSVRKAGQRLRISVQLVRADNGYHLWSETYDRTLDDVFKIQDEIAGSVVEALKVSLLEGSVPKAIGTKNTEAYALYLQAKFLIPRANSREDWERINEYLQQAIKLDPMYAPSWAILSRARADQADYRLMPRQLGRQEARRAAEKALALDPQLADAHTAMAAILFDDWDWDGEQAQIQRALELEPGNAWALSWAAYRALRFGRPDDAIKLYERVVASDPINANWYYQFSAALFIAGKLPEALTAAQKSLDLDPAELGGHARTALIILSTGDAEAALVEANREGDRESRLFGLAITYYAVGRRRDADLALSELEKDFAKTDPYDLALVHAFRGEVDQSFTWLDRAYQQRDWECAGVKVDGIGPLLFFKNLSADPRYKAFLKKMKLPE